MGHFRVAGLTHIHDHWDDDPRRFLVQLQCEVSREDELGGEAFSLTVASPAQLERQLGPLDLKLGRGYVLMSDYDEGRLTAFLQGLLERSGAETWPDLQAFVERFFDWV